MLGSTILIRSAKFFIVLLLILIISSSMQVFSAYRQEYSIGREGNLYILDIDINIYRIGNYGVISIYMKSDGVYAYGITVLKDPDKEALSMYLMLGAQDEWYDLGEAAGPNIRFRLFIDVNSSKAVVIYNSCSLREYNLSYIPRLKKLYVSSFNITGRSANYPGFAVNSLKVYVLNSTINDLKNYYCEPNLDLIINKIVGNFTIINITSTAATSTTTSEGGSWPGPWYLLLIIPAFILVLVLFLFKRSSHEYRSPGP